jgi:hypothetical protein
MKNWLIRAASLYVFNVVVLLTSGVLYAVCAVATLAVPSVWRMGRRAHTVEVADS